MACTAVQDEALLMQGLWVALMTLTTLLLLLPHSGFTHVWHIASEQFNSANDYSPVWEAYRVSDAPLGVHLHGQIFDKHLQTHVDCQIYNA